MSNLDMAKIFAEIFSNSNEITQVPSQDNDNILFEMDPLQRCRICLRQELNTMDDEPKFYSIYDFYKNERELRILDIISQALPNLMIHESDLLSKKICSGCMNVVLLIYQFQNLANISEYIARDNLDRSMVHANAAMVMVKIVDDLLKDHACKLIKLYRINTQIDTVEVIAPVSQPIVTEREPPQELRAYVDDIPNYYSMDAVAYEVEVTTDSESTPNNDLDIEDSGVEEFIEMKVNNSENSTSTETQPIESVSMPTQEDSDSVPKMLDLSVEGFLEMVIQNSGNLTPQTIDTPAMPTQEDSDSVPIMLDLTAQEFIELEEENSGNLTPTEPEPIDSAPMPTQEDSVPIMLDLAAEELIEMEVDNSDNLTPTEVEQIETPPMPTHDNSVSTQVDNSKSGQIKASSMCSKVQTITLNPNKTIVPDYEFFARQAYLPCDNNLQPPQSKRLKPTPQYDNIDEYKDCVFVMKGDGDKPYGCMRCGVYFATIGLMREHDRECRVNQQQKHEIVKLLCPYCLHVADCIRTIGDTPDGPEISERSRHCEKCRQTFIYYNKIAFECNVCTQVFSSIEDLDEHKQMHNSQNGGEYIAPGTKTGLLQLLNRTHPPSNGSN